MSIVGTGIKRVLVTGSSGQLGGALIAELRKKYGASNIIASDVREPQDGATGPFVFGDVTNFKQMKDIVSELKVDTIVHFSALLSAIGEQNVDLALDVNVTGFRNMLTLARDNRLRIFCPSTIGAFGPTTPRDLTPDVTIQNPTTVYGVTKVFAERLGEYFRKRFDVDFRCLRYPGVISADSAPGGGTTDYAVEIFHEALKNKEYTSFLSANTALPMMYMPDCIKATVQILEAPREQLLQSVYNVQAISFTPAQIAQEIKKHIPDFQMKYSSGDFRQQIADSWPRSLDDSAARKHWGWKHDYNMEEMVNDMFEKLRHQLKVKAQNASCSHSVGYAQAKGIRMNA